MKKSDLVRHLGLALAGSEEQFRERVEKIYRLSEVRQASNVPLPRTRVEWRQGRMSDGRWWWDATLSREDSKLVVELFVDFLQRKGYEDEHYQILNGGKPIRKEPGYYTFRFLELQTLEKIADDKRKAKGPRKVNDDKKKLPSVDELAALLEKVPMEQRAALLAQLLKQ